MAIRKAAELFGDDGDNGPRVPIDTNPPLGHGPKNRAVGFGEPLTSMAANRISYALALNDDDLDGRIAAYESGGLDTVYRKGKANVPGGGRFIDVDGGAVEARSSVAQAYAGDRANAQIRARVETTNVDGVGGFDFVGRAGGVADPAPGRAGFGYLDRRAVVFTGPRTNLAFTQSATLNANGAGRTTLTVGTPAYFSSSQGTDLMPGIDLVEVFDSPYQGLYVLGDLGNANRVTLLRFDGQAPNFAPNTAVTCRMYRPVFQSAGGKVGTGPVHSARFVALGGDSDVPALSLVQPGTGYLLACHNRAGTRVLSVDVSGNLAAAEVSGALLKGARAEISGELKAGSLVVTSGTITAPSIGSTSSTLRGQRFLGGGFEGTYAILNGPLTADGVTVTDGYTLNIDGGDLMIWFSGNVGGRVYGRTAHFMQELRAGTGRIDTHLEVGDITTTNPSTFGGKNTFNNDVEIKGTLQLSQPGGIVSAPQFNISPAQQHTNHRVPLSLWRLAAPLDGLPTKNYWVESLGTNGLPRCFFVDDHVYTGGSILIIPITGVIHYATRVTTITLRYYNTGYPVPPSARIVRTDPASYMPVTTQGPIGLTRVGAPQQLLETSFEFTWTSTATSLPNRTTDPPNEVWITANAMPGTSDHTFQLLDCVVTHARTMIA